MLRRYIFIFILLPVLTIAKETGEPKWLKNIPISDTHYIGIARVSIKAFPDTYRQKALNIALSFISSEISVRVKSRTKDISKDFNDEIDLKFTSESITFSSEDLEGYQIVDTWKSRKEFAIYCRLSKAKHLETKRKPFVNDLILMAEDYDKLESAISKRNLNRVLSISSSLELKSKGIIRNKNFIPYLTNYELRTLAEYKDFYSKLIGDIHIIVKSNPIHPFTWLNGFIKISLVDNKKNPWTNWNGVLLKNNEVLNQFEKQSREIISFPLSIFISSTHSLSFNLLLQRQVGKKFRDVKTMTFKIPISSKNLSLRSIKVKGISKSLKDDIEEIINQFLSVSNNKTENIEETAPVIDIVAKFTKTYASSGWVSGILEFTFENTSTNSQQGVGKVSITCGGRTSRQAIKNGFNDLRKSINNNSLIWK